ncbi:MAG: L,D-transpeptidase/peptidoglycan binding protein [Actinobacteria bacterium]|nr:L,D-transpeptidase/peptidoglycan binding protein [Actinomycetota bacterium]
MPRIALITAVALAIVVAGGVGALASAAGSSAERLPAGARVAGVDVGGLTRQQALERARRRVAAPIARPAHVLLGERRYTLSATEAGVRVDPRGAVQRAYAAGREGSFVARGWRALTGAKVVVDVPVPVSVDRAAISKFVGRIEREQSRKPVDASLKLTLTSVSIEPSRPGRRLAARDALVARLARRLTSPSDQRTVRARTVPVAPKITEKKVFDANPVAVTVSRGERRARVFRRGELVRTYTVAVGSPEYPTPTGQFVVQTMQKNPAWSVPRSEWAGSLAGQTIPGGDPRNPLVARWIGFNGSVGFHGTSSAGSLGSAASHGCIRMSPAEVTDLFERVRLGTPVLVA